MDLLAQYGGDGVEAEEAGAEEVAPMRRVISAPKDSAPQVNSACLTLVQDGDRQMVVSVADTQNLHDPTKKKIYYNVKYDDLHEPLAGPAHPFRSDGVARGQRNHATGHVETAYMDKFTFEEQYSTFMTHGYGAEPGGNGFVGNVEALAENGADTVFSMNNAKRRKVREMVLAEVAAEDDGERPDYSAWAPARDAIKPLLTGDLTEEAKEFVTWHAARREANLRARGKLRDADGNKITDAMVVAQEEDEEGAGPKGDRSFFHGKEAKNYIGESWITPPKDRKKENDHTFIPKRCIHTWSGHTKGVQAIRFFPNHGHLLLSAGLDSKLKIWDVHGNGKCMRTYLGHEKAIKDIQWVANGERFISSSWDKKIKLWDTETGQVITTLTSGKIAYAVRGHPDADKQNILMAGQSDKKILQYDMNTGDVVQEYDQHLGAVNSVTFCDEGRRFVTSSDDKSLRVWEYGIPVVMKYIADPTMHSMPTVAASPNGNWLACQSLDNQIMIYSTKDRFRLNKKKRFTGHSNAGYACQVGFSPDMRFIMSGDADGKLHFWDWKSQKIFKTLKCHDKVVIGCEWHPLEQSKVATCSWDGTIKYWD